MRPLFFVVASLAGGAVFADSMAHAKTLSINFYDSATAATTLASSDVAGLAAVAAPQWNNVDRAGGTPIAGDTIGSNELILPGGTLKDDGGCSTGIAMQWAAAGNDSLELHSGGPSPDHTMMSGGGRTILRSSGNHFSQLELAGLLAEFLPGYSVYLYFGRGSSDTSGFHPNTSKQGGWGDIVVSGAGTYTTDMSDVPGAPITTAPFNTLEPTQFDGTFVQSTAQSVMGNYSVISGQSLDTLTLTFDPVLGSGDEIYPSVFAAGFDTFNLVGLQVVGDEAVFFGSGDTDDDGDVDTADLTVMFQNFTGHVGCAGGKTLAEGDTDTDGDVDTSDLTVAFQNFTGAPPSFDPADADKDGDVDTADLTVMFQNFTGAVGGAGGKMMAEGDTDTDGDVDTADLTVAFQNFTGSQFAGLGGNFQPVPEPSSLVLWVLGLVGLAGLRRLRQWPVPRPPKEGPSIDVS